MRLVNIDWSLMGRAVDIYKAFGYQYVETQWVVEDECCEATYVTDKYKTSGAQLVASGEQGLLQKGLDFGLKTDTKYMTVSPCFRWEDPVDRLHQRQFLKLELMISYPHIPRVATQILINDAKKVMNSLHSGSDCIYTIDTDEGIDLVYNDIELGSYGYREATILGGRFKWAYGTGLALPRFSQAFH